MRCPSCEAENLAKAPYCANCGVPLEAQAGEEPPVIYCTKCGTGNRRDVELCGGCGASLQVSRASGVPPRVFPRRGQPGETVGRLVHRDLGDLVGETFRVYKGSFWVFVIIALVAQVPLAIQQLVPNLALSVVLFIAAVFLSILAAGATVRAVASHYLGTEISVGNCYRRAWDRTLSLLGSEITFIIALLISFVLVIGIPLFFYLLVSWFFYAQAIMLEGRKGPRNALRRSGELVRGSWWRVFGIGIVFVLLLIIINTGASIPGFIASDSSPIVGAVLISLAGAVVTPIGFIGATLVYFDLRIRKEGYTLETMSSEVGA